jgi:hypothetical protein
VQGLPAGVGRFFGRVGLGAQRIKEAATEPEETPVSEKAGEVATRARPGSVLKVQQNRAEKKVMVCGVMSDIAESF